MLLLMVHFSAQWVFRVHTLNSHNSGELCVNKWIDGPNSEETNLARIKDEKLKNENTQRMARNKNYTTKRTDHDKVEN